MILLLGFAVAFGAAVWLVFDWIRYPEAPLRVQRPAGSRLAKLQRFLLEAGVSDRVKPWPFVWLCLGLGVLVGLIAYQVLGLVVLAVAAAMSGALVPAVVVSWLRSQRQRRVEESLGDVLAFLQNGIEQGRSIRESLGLLRERGPVALRPDFARLERQMRVDFEQALLDLQERLANPIWDRCTAGLLLGHRLGEESLGGVLARLAAMNREEQRLHRALKAQQAQVHMAARIACAVPFITMFGIRLLLPGAAAYYASPAGELILLASIALVVGGYWWMLYLGRVPGIERVPS